MLTALLAYDARLSAVWQAVSGRMSQDSAHDAGHLLRVAVWAARLYPDQPGLAVAAAFTHDLMNLPKDHPERAQAAERSAQQAAELLLVCGFADAEAQQVAAAVRDHSFSGGRHPDTPLAMALQDADRLDALGAVGVLRCAAVGGSLGRAPMDPEDPWALTREPDDSHFTLDHFFTKLLRLPARFHTAQGRAEAERRARLMLDFLAALGEESGQPLPPVRARYEI